MSLTKKNYTTDYFPFGMPMPNRTYSLSSGSKYRFGFNGVEKESDIYGEGNGYEFKYRVHDARIGRFLSVDPLYKEYPWNSTYAFAENDVIRCIDLEGLEKFVVTETSNIDNTGKLSHINIQKVAMNVNFSVEYIHRNNLGVEISRQIRSSFSQIEDIAMNMDYGNSGVSRCEAMNNGRFRSTANPMNESRFLSGYNFYKFNFAAKFITDKSSLNETDLQPGTFAQINQDINILRNYIVNGANISMTFRAFGSPQDGSFTNINIPLRNYNIVITGETDSSPSPYNNGCGNPCLAQDRATSVQNTIIDIFPSATTSTIIHSGEVKAEDRQSTVLFLPK